MRHLVFSGSSSTVEPGLRRSHSLAAGNLGDFPFRGPWGQASHPRCVPGPACAVMMWGFDLPSQ